MAFLRAFMGFARESPVTSGEAGEVLLRTPAGVGAGPAEAPGLDKLWARGARAWVAEEEAAVSAAGDEVSAADLAAGVREDPGVERGVIELAAEAEVGSGD